MQRFFAGYCAFRSAVRMLGLVSTWGGADWPAMHLVHGGANIGKGRPV
ncbi:hypothetical protein SAMN04488515_3521 [Cognatiyoonia koreensis]|uniref:Uncharacterized protein n=1 Tax=Cognatiyoonia koreensis TaxID=364200 RepID=A0A1I0RZD3_9RHOB|nr:hypothetical protein SAMN04488515_3521 [Cognatiyoonia koreensis]